jgi:hypothetical protein
MARVELAPDRDVGDPRGVGNVKAGPNCSPALLPPPTPPTSNGAAGATSAGWNRRLAMDIGVRTLRWVDAGRGAVPGVRVPLGGVAAVAPLARVLELGALEGCPWPSSQS